MKNKLSRFAVPYEVWMAIFVVAPIVIMVVYAFSSADGGFTLDNFVQMGGYTEVFLRSFKLAIIATMICLIIGYPVSYLMSREGASFQRTAMVLIMLPMWMNFLLRTYSWMTILENNGLLNQLFQKIGLISLYNHIFGTSLEYFSMMNTQGAVVLGMVYNYLPFMILPIYSVIIKLDHSLLEAARDLGAGSMTVFRRVDEFVAVAGGAAGAPDHGLRHTADRPYLLQYPLCDPVRGAQAAADGPQPHRCGAGLGLHVDAGLLACGDPGDQARHRLRRSDGLHHVCG